MLPLACVYVYYVCIYAYIKQYTEENVMNLTGDVKDMGRGMGEREIQKTVNLSGFFFTSRLLVN